MNAPATTSAARPAARLLPPQGWRGLALLVVEGVAAGLFVSLVLAVAVFIAATQAQAATQAASPRGDVAARHAAPCAPSATVGGHAPPSPDSTVVNCAGAVVALSPAEAPMFGLVGLAMVALGWVARRRSFGSGGRDAASQGARANRRSASADEVSLARRAEIARCVC
jgi:hypothetical protein